MGREILNRSVRKRPEKITLVVGRRKFFLKRRTLVQGSPYFRAMLEGSFAESRTNRVVLKSVSDPHVFQAFLDYAFKEKQSFLRHTPYLASALDLAHMYCQDNVADRVREDLLHNWMDTTDMKHVVEIAARLDVKGRILRGLYEQVSCAFFGYGFQLTTRRLNRRQYQESLKDLACNTALLLSFFQLEESAWLCFSDPRGRNNYFAKGVMNWALGEKIAEDDVVHIVRRLRLEYLQENVFNDLIGSLPDLASCVPYRRQLKLNYFGVRDRIGDAVSQVIFGCVDPERLIFSFDMKKWRWDEMLACKDVRLSDRDYSRFESGRSLCFSLLPFYQGFFLDADHVETEEQFDFFPLLFNFHNANIMPSSIQLYHSVGAFRNNVLQKGNLYCSGVGNRTGSEYESDVLVFSCIPRGSDMNLSIIGRVKRLKSVLACQVVIVGNVLHGFVCHKPGGEGTTVSHFDVDVQSTEGTQETVDIVNLVPLVTDVPGLFIVIAAAATSPGIVLLFLCDSYFCLTQYDIKLKDMEILGFLPQCQFNDPKNNLPPHIRSANGLFYLRGNV